ncbi:MAG: ribonuclease III [Bacteroidia bacterium]|nr:ribonuclease III [Bacteroidia bacterium]
MGYCPRNLKLYKQAFLHNSTAEKIVGLKTKNNNERLEYLGDAVLDLIIAELLFKKFPFRGEGFLTEMRSKAVSRKRLSQIAYDMGIHEHLLFDKSISRNHSAIRGISGNALEALIGSIYLDKGYRFTRHYIKKKIVVPHLDFEHLKDVTENFKSLLNQHAQKERKELEFKVLEQNDKNKQKMYTIGVLINGEEIATGRGRSKKVAEQIASEKTCEILSLI